MSTFIDQKYISQISPKLDQFKKTSDNVYNFRCPFCGDSKKRKNKTRGYLFLDKFVWKFKCHNCSHSTNLYGLIEYLDPFLYKQYSYEKFLDSPEGHSKTPKKKVKSSFSFRNKKRLPYLETSFGELKKISQLDPDNIAKQYVVDRKIPNTYHHELFYTDKYYKFCNKFIPKKFNEDQVKKKDRRLVVPFIDKSGSLIAFQGRSLGDSSIRYITIVVNDDAIRAFGINRVDLKKTIYVLEGPIDSMFIENSIAMGGSDLNDLNTLKNVDFVFLYDNEHRNKEIRKKIKDRIDGGFGVVLLPNKYKKDINDMILDGYSIEDVNELIRKHTYRGLEAATNFKFWSIGKWT